MIPRTTVICLGLAQLISWGTSYYLIGGFGEAIAADLGVSRDLAYGGFSLALLVMGLSSPLVGRLIDRHGGRAVMNIGALLNAAGCVMLALCHGVALYFAAWVCLGLAMRLTLYDAAFAALARLGGVAARRAMSQITLPGGLASTVFWPFGHLIAEHAGWRGAVLAYAACALLTIPLHLSIPHGRHDAQAAVGSPLPRPLARTARQRALAGALYAAIVMGTNFLNAAMSAHMIAILAGLGLAAAAAVWVATLRGIGQSSARLLEVLFGGRLHPLSLNLVACGTLPFAFVAGLFSGEAGIAALVFAFVYGAANGIVTITRGTLPLMLFDPGSYGALVGRLLVPGFIVSAAAPLAYAAVIGRFGELGALWLSLASAVLVAGAAVWLAVAFRSGTARDT
ncbi:MAG: MFS transporter [Pseudomonadota bacterium]